MSERARMPPTPPIAIVCLTVPEGRRIALAEVAGLPVALRNLLAAARAGVRRFVLPAALRTKELEGPASRDPRLAGAIRWADRLEEAERRRLEREPLLFLPADSLFEPGLIQTLLAASPPPRGGGTVLLDGGGPIPVLLADPALAAPLFRLAADGAPIHEALEADLRRGAVRPHPVPGDLWLPIPTSEELAAAEARLCAARGIANDGVVDRWVNRRLSRPLTRLLVRLPVTPNQVSLASLAFGLLGAVGVWAGSLAFSALGLGLYQIATILDHTDGELARLKLLESPQGAWLDVAIDTLIHGALALALGLTAARVLDLPILRGVGLAAALGVAASALVAKWLALPAETGRGLRGLLGWMANRDLFYLILLASLVALWLHPPALAWLLAILALGSHAYWLAAAGVRVATRR
ncbi:MAG: CDP-alcohol phosphatidyltransferase family protein [Candidatus Rokubacteria bacterium]|nr:CDP-alcohol phosphatidyltransferase family protein [Candidatus Rokubacteria bacterium]